MLFRSVVILEVAPEPDVCLALTDGPEHHLAHSLVGLDLLTRVGLGELAAPDTDAYVAIAATLGRDLQRLSEIRSGLRERMRSSPLCDGVGFAVGFGRALRDMWRHWCGG